MVKGDDNPVGAGAGQPRSGRSMIVSLALFTGVSGALFYGGLSLVQPQYRSAARIYVERAGEAPGLSVAKEIKALTSPKFKKAFIATAGLAGDAEYNGELARHRGPLSKVAMDLGVISNPASLSAQERVEAAFAQKFSILKGREAGTIVIAVRSNVPQKAARLANEYVSSYLALIKAMNQPQKRSQNRAGRKIKAHLIAGMRKQVATKKRALDALRKDMVSKPFGRSRRDGASGAGRQMASGDTNSPLSSKLQLDKDQVFELTSQYILARADRKAADLRVQLVEELLNSSGKINSSALGLNSGTIQVLLTRHEQLEKRISTVSEKLLPSHPRLKRLNRQKEALGKEIRGEAKNVVARLQAEALLLAEREKAFKDSLDKLNKVSVPKHVPEGVAKDPRIKTQIILTRELAQKEQELAGLVAQARQFDLQELARLSADKRTLIKGSLVQQAVAAQSPVFPRKIPMTVLGMIAAFALGLLFMVLTGGNKRARRKGASSGTGLSIVEDQMPKMLKSRPLVPEEGAAGI